MSWRPLAALRGGEWGGVVGFKAIVAYNFLKVMAGPMWMKLSFLAGISYILVLISASTLVIIGYTKDWKSAMFESYAILNKVPASSSVHAKDPLHSFFLNAIYILRFATFTVALSTISSSIGSAIEQTLMGNHQQTSERGHTLLLNWSTNTIPTLLQLESARKDGRLLSTVIVLGDKPKAEMDQEIADRVGSVGIHILTRQGNPTTIRALQRVSAGAAKMVLVSIPDEITGGEQQAQELLATQLTCLGILRHRRQPSRKVGFRDKDVHLVVTAPFTPPSEVLNGASFCPRNDFVERLLALSALHPGIARVYQEILHSSSGSELYVRGIEDWPWLHGLTFWEAGKHFDSAVVLGWFESEEAAAEGRGEAKLCLHPRRDHVIKKGCKLILLAQDSNPRCSRVRQQCATPDGTDSPIVSTIDTDPRAHILGPKGRKILVLNYLDQTTLLQRLDETLPSGSVVEVQVSNPDVKVPRGKRAKFQICATGFLSASASKELKWSSFDACIILQDAEPPEGADVDSRALAAISFGLAALATEERTKPLHLVVSLMKRRTRGSIRAVVQGAGVSVDTIFPQLLESGALVQVLLSPPLQPLYTHLLSSSRSEISFLDATDAVPAGSSVTVGSLSAMLEHQNLLVLGLLPHDAPLSLAPRQSKRLTIDHGDRLVVMKAS